MALLVMTAAASPVRVSGGAQILNSPSFHQRPRHTSQPFCISGTRSCGRTPSQGTQQCANLHFFITHCRHRTTHPARQSDRLGRIRLVSLGHVIATPAALAPIKEHGVPVQELLHRHLTGDWQEMCQQDQDANEIKKPIGQRFPTANPVFSPRSTLAPKARPASPSWFGT